MEAQGHNAPREEHGRGGEKSPDAFRTISEVSTALDVPQHVLRFWEGKFAQIRPLKRGGGRRYYRPDDVDLLRGIQALLYSDGYTIKGVQKLLRENGVKFVIAAGRRRNEPKGRGAAASAPKNAAQTVEAPRAARGFAEIEDEDVSPEAAPEFADWPLADHEVEELTREHEASLGDEPAEAGDRAPTEAEAEVILAEARAAGTPPVARREAAARLLSHLKGLRRDYDLRLRAAKNGRAR